MALFAHFAATARLGWINCHPRSNLQRLKMAVEGICTHSLDHSAEFVAQNERFGDYRVADAAIQVVVQVTTAHAHTGYPQEHLAETGRARTRNLFDAQITRAVQTNGIH
jgi:hypothetical protein